MKKLCKLSLSIILTLALWGLNTGCQNSTKSPVDYNNEIIDNQSKIIQKIINLSNSFDKRDANEMENLYQVLKKQIDESIDTISNLDEYEGNTQFRDASIKLFKFYQSVVGKEYREMIDILKKKDSELSQKDVDRIDALTIDISKREEGLDEEFAKVQKEFADKYNIQIQENILQKKIDKMGK